MKATASTTAVFKQKKASYHYRDVHKAVSQLFYHLGLDAANYDKPNWNPLGCLIHPGDVVVLKPNWIRESHQYNPYEWEQVITNPTVIEVVLLYTLKALQRRGKVIITDGPQTDSNFQKLMEHMQPERWKQMGLESNIEVDILDLRDHQWISVGEVVVDRKKLPGDPLGSTEVNLGSNSEFVNHRVSHLGYYGADYYKQETNKVHTGLIHKYRVSKTVMSADVFINLPKLKTHKKVGITCCLKNLVGINTYKNWLPHHNEGTVEQGGDQFPVDNVKNKLEINLMAIIKSFLYNKPLLSKAFIPLKALGMKIFGNTREVIRSGNWYGNDTAWRMVLDLNKVLLYGNPDGSFRKDKVKSWKRYFTIVDGIIGGDGNGPMAPNAVNSGLLIGGFNPLAVDCVCAKLIGFDYAKISMLKKGFDVSHLPIGNFKYENIDVASNIPAFNRKLIEIESKHTFNFEPHFGWKNQIEA